MSEKYSEEYKRYISEIFLFRARMLFGLLLSFLYEKVCVSQSKLGRKSELYRKYLILKRYIYPEKGSVGQSGISRIVKNERPPGYTQVFVWLKVLRDIFDSDEYKNLCINTGEAIFEFTEELETDMWRLALLGTPKEVVAAHERHKHLIDESSPVFIAAYDEHRRKLQAR
ncbi:MAG TPA: hypothetical protein VHV10_17365 [Ktedonobacteraceae bacterium]|nr:hypothetical protein [Ktedonobacteraceae bacterium]